MGVDYKFLYGIGYFIPNEHAKEFYGMLLEIADDNEDLYERFLVDGYNPEKEPIALFANIQFEAHLEGVEQAKSKFIEGKEWVNPDPKLPENMKEFMKEKGEYGLIEFHLWN